MKKATIAALALLLAGPAFGQGIEFKPAPAAGGGDITPGTTAVTGKSDCFGFADASGLFQCDNTVAKLDSAGAGNGVITARKTIDGANINTNFFRVSGTFPGTLTASTAGVIFSFDTAGNSAQSNIGIATFLNAGFTGAGRTIANYNSNPVAGTWAWSSGFLSLAGNVGTYNEATGTTTGTNFGSINYGGGGDISIGAYNLAPVSKNSGTNGGTVGIGVNGGTSPTFFGGYFGLNSALPTFESAGLIADNSDKAAPVFLGRANGIVRMEVAQAGGWYLGRSGGVASPVAGTISGEGARGGTDTNTAGANVTISAGQGTGTGTVSTLIFQTPTVGTTGTTAQTMATRGIFSSSGFQTSPASATTNVCIGSTGAAATCTGASNSVAYGNNASINGSFQTSIGGGSSASGARGIAIGGVTSAGADAVAIGSSITNGNAGEVWIANSNATNGYNNFYFGKGKTSASAASVTFHGTGGSGTNNAGGSVFVEAGVGTGTAAGGDVALRRSTSIATGTTAQIAADAFYVRSQAKALTAATATAFARINLDQGVAGVTGWTGGTVFYTLAANDASNFQSRSGHQDFSIVNVGGTEVCAFGTGSTESIANSSGTTTLTFDTDTSPTNGCDLRATGASSLTETTLSLFYSIIMNGPGTVTPQ